MRDGIRWLAGDPRHRSALEGCIRDVARAGPGVEIVAEKPGRRRLASADLASGERVFLKHYPPASRQRLRAWCKRRLGWSADAREWRMLGRLRRAGVRVPEPLAHAALPDGGRVVATRFVAGRPLADALRGAAHARRAHDAHARRALLDAVGALIRSMHLAGVIHRDLHVGNLFVDASGPLLLDLQMALPSRSRQGRLRDLGELDASLASRASRSDRVRVAIAALGARRPWDASAREAIRAVSRASRARARAHWRSRTRRALRSGRQYAQLAIGARRGMRLRDVPEARIAGWLSESPRDPRIAVQQFGSAGLGAMLAAWRHGSPARRAWCAGAGLRARGIAAERPLAYLEARRFGLPSHSTLVVESLPVADAAWLQASPERWLAALAGLLDAMRERDVQHRALASGALRRSEAGVWALGMLEAVEFRPLSPAAPIDELEQLATQLVSGLDADTQARVRSGLRDVAEARGFRAAPQGHEPARARLDQRGEIVTQR